MSRTPYPTDLSDAQWRRIAQLVPPPKPGGRPARYPRREVVNAILYQARNGTTACERTCGGPPVEGPGRRPPSSTASR